MKRSICVFVALLLCAAFAGSAWCEGSMIRKLGRGISNALTCPLEIPQQISAVNANDGPMAACTYGVLKGIGMTCARAVVGVYEVVTFPIPLPKGYRPILTEPEFFLEELS